MANPFKNPDLRKVYDGYLEFARQYPEGPLYTRGGRFVGRHRGSSSRCAFWDGYDGMPNHKYPTGSQSYAAYRAGQAFRKEDDTK